MPPFSCNFLARKSLSSPRSRQTFEPKNTKQSFSKVAALKNWHSVWKSFKTSPHCAVVHSTCISSGDDKMTCQRKCELSAATWKTAKKCFPRAFSSLHLVINPLAASAFGCQFPSFVLAKAPSLQQLCGYGLLYHGCWKAGGRRLGKEEEHSHTLVCQSPK